jgi:hypothetical protein
MSNGDPIKAGEQTQATEMTRLFAAGDQNFNFSGFAISYVGVPTNRGDGGVTQDVDGIAAWGINGGTGVRGWGGLREGTGVVGWGGVNFDGDRGVVQYGGAGVVGAGGSGVTGYSWPVSSGGESVPAINAGWGVLGYGGAGDSAANIASNQVDGQAAIPGVGVLGEGGDANGSGSPGTGVVGVAPVDVIGADFSPFPIYTGNGVAGTGPTGVYGFSPQGVGVMGVGGPGGQGVVGQVPVATNLSEMGAIAVHGSVVGSRTGLLGPFAGLFDGPVQVNDLLLGASDLLVFGDFTVLGHKSVAVPFPDGSHRRLYCVESPECWFEDFGEAKLVKGKAKIKLPRDFAAAIRTASYHVFLAPYGDSNGLYVSKRTRLGFVVEEQGKGKSSLKFSFRIAGKRKHIEAPRFARVVMPKLPKRPKAPMLPKLTARKEPKPPKRPELRVPPSAALNAVAPKPSSRRRSS